MPRETEFSPPRKALQGLITSSDCVIAADVVLLRIGAHELSARPRRARVGGAAIVTAFFAVTIANGTLDLQRSGTEVAYVLAMLLPLILAMHLVVCLLRREHPLLDRAGGWWTRRALARLAARGLRPLTPSDAPLFYARVDAAGNEWAYEVRVGQDIVAAGRCKRERNADQAAARACFEHTFRAPFARRPGALYVLGCPTGSPYQRQVTELFSAASTIPGTFGSRRRLSVLPRSDRSRRTATLLSAAEGRTRGRSRAVDGRGRRLARADHGRQRCRTSRSDAGLVGCGGRAAVVIVLPLRQPWAELVRSLGSQRAGRGGEGQNCTFRLTTLRARWRRGSGRCDHPGHGRS